MTSPGFLTMEFSFWPREKGSVEALEGRLEGASTPGLRCGGQRTCDQPWRGIPEGERRAQRCRSGHGLQEQHASRQGQVRWPLEQGWTTSACESVGQRSERVRPQAGRRGSQHCRPKTDGQILTRTLYQHLLVERPRGCPHALPLYHLPGIYHSTTLPGIYQVDGRCFRALSE